MRSGARSTWSDAAAVGQLLSLHMRRLYQRAFTVITTNPAFADPKMTAALLDHLPHNCEIIGTRDESWRFENRS